MQIKIDDCFSCIYLSGEDVALYFAWMKFFGTFLCYSTAVGLVLYFLRPSIASIDNDPYVPLFSLFIVVWGVLFIIVSDVYIYIYIYIHIYIYTYICIST